MRNSSIIFLGVGWAFAISAATAESGILDGKAEVRDSAPETQHVVFFAGRKPVFLRLQLWVDGQGFRIWQSVYITKLFVMLDRDGNGSLDRQEAQEIASLADLGASAAEIGFDEIDQSPPDGRITRDELTRHIKAAMGGAFLIAARRQRASQSIELFRKLDRDSDGRLTADEIADASEALRKLDLNDDGVFSAEELRPFRDPFQPGNLVLQNDATALTPFRMIPTDGPFDELIEELLVRYDTADGDAPDGQLTASEIGVPPEDLVNCDLDANGRLNREELRSFLQKPYPHLSLRIDLPNRQPGRTQLSVLPGISPDVQHRAQQRDNRIQLAVDRIAIEVRTRNSRPEWGDNSQFYKLQFRIADTDKNAYLDQSELGRLNLPGASFEDLDRNSDGMVFEEEVIRYLEDERESVRDQVVMSVTDEGKSLFEVLDANQDLRLSWREFNEASQQIRTLDLDGDGQLAGTELTGQYRLTFEMAKPNLFAAQPMPPDQPPGSRVPDTDSLPGPEWFRKMDVNRDGDLSPREFLAPREVFDRLDANGDGLISAEEAAQAEQIGKKPDPSGDRAS